MRRVLVVLMSVLTAFMCMPLVQKTNAEAATEKQYHLSQVSDQIKMIGRTAVDENGVYVSWSNSGIAFSGEFEGEVKLTAEGFTSYYPYHNIVVVVDGNYAAPDRFPVYKGQKTYTIATVEKGNHIAVQEVDGGLYPVRFSEARLEDYKKYPVIPYSGCTTGVTMEFITDAPVIQFEYEITQNWWGTGFDVYENGKLQEYVEIGSRKWGRFEYSRKETEAPSEIVICLPPASQTVIIDPVLGNFKTDITDDRPKVLILGDSISQGLYGASPSRNWPFLFAQAKKADYLNLSVGGETFRPQALDEDIPFQPDHIIVALGTNDIFNKRYVNIIEKDVQDYLERLHKIYEGVPVTVITPFAQYGMSESSNMLNSDRHRAVAEIIEKAAEEYGYQVIRGTDLFPNEAKYFAENDSVHLSALGFETIAEKLEALIEIKTA